MVLNSKGWCNYAQVNLNQPILIRKPPMQKIMTMGIIKNRHNICGILLAAVLFMPFAAKAAALNIYSYRQSHLLKPFLDLYTAETGISFNVVHAPKGLAQRLKAEGASSPADIVLTTNISRLVELDDMGLLTPFHSAVIEARVPANLRNSQNTWTALSIRARVIVVSKTRVADGAITSIKDLAKPMWKGRLCSRRGSHVYNRALLASLVVHDGEAAAEVWAEGYVSNLARRPQGNDRAQAKAIYAGECDVALMNTYYLGNMKFNEKNPEQRDWADALRLVFTDQDGRGQHVNIAGGGIVKTSSRPKMAKDFLEWMTGAKAQQTYAGINFEYPVNSAVAKNAEVASWGRFKADNTSLEAIARASATAQRIIDRTGW